MFFKNLLILISILLIIIFTNIYLIIKRKTHIFQLLINTVYLIFITVDAIILIMYLGNNKLLFMSFFLLFIPLLLNIIAFPIVNYLRNKFLDQNINKNHKNYIRYNLISAIIMITINIFIMTSNYNDWLLLSIIVFLFVLLILMFTLPNYILIKSIIKNEHLLNDVYLPIEKKYQKLHLKYVTNEKYLELINLLNTKIIPDYIIAKEQHNVEIQNKCLNIIDDYLSKIDINRIHKSDIDIDNKFEHDEKLLKKLEEMIK